MTSDFLEYKRQLQLLGICMPAFICIHKLQELCWMDSASIRASVSIHSLLTKHNFGESSSWEFVSPVFSVCQTTDADRQNCCTSSATLLCFSSLLYNSSSLICSILFKCSGWVLCSTLNELSSYMNIYMNIYVVCTFLLYSTQVLYLSSLLCSTLCLSSLL